MNPFINPRKRDFLLPVFLSAVLLAGCSKHRPAVSPGSTGENTSISAFATAYTNLKKVTPIEVDVNPKIASACAGISKDQADAARIRFGPHANTAILI
jgi:hypothetical protein